MTCGSVMNFFRVPTLFSWKYFPGTFLGRFFSRWVDHRFTLCFVYFIVVMFDILDKLICFFLRHFNIYSGPLSIAGVRFQDSPRSKKKKIHNPRILKTCCSLTWKWVLDFPGLPGYLGTIWHMSPSKHEVTRNPRPTVLTRFQPNPALSWWQSMWSQAQHVHRYSPFIKAEQARGVSVRQWKPCEGRPVGREPEPLGAQTSAEPEVSTETLSRGQINPPWQPGVTQHFRFSERTLLLVSFYGHTLYSQLALLGEVKTATVEILALDPLVGGEGSSLWRCSLMLIRL